MSISRRKLSVMEDGELMGRYAETGRKEYCGELFVRYLPLIYGVLLKYFRDGNAAKEAVPVFLRQCLEQIPGKDPTDVAGMLYALATGFAIGNAPARDGEGTIPFNTGLSDGETAFARSLATGEEWAVELFESGKKALNRSQRECVSLFFLEARSFEDIAATTGYLYGDVGGYVESGIRVLCEKLPDREVRTQ